MLIRERISEDLKTAMRGRDAARLSSLRLIKTELAKAEANIGDHLDDAAATSILQKMTKQRRDSIQQFRAGNRNDLAEKEEAELAVIESYLPASITLEQIDQVIDETLAEIGPQDADSTTGVLVGRVIKRLKDIGLPFDGRLVNERVIRRLRP